MPAETKIRALDAAVALLGTRGIRAMTHARIDAHAGLPNGSTSNWFRTRQALVDGVVAWIAERERTDFAAAPAPPMRTLDDLIEGLHRMLIAQSGRHAARTRARYALFVEYAEDPSVCRPLLEQRGAFVEWTQGLVGAVGIPDPDTATPAIMALCDGLLLHRLSVDPTLEVRPALERGIRALAADERR